MKLYYRYINCFKYGVISPNINFSSCIVFPVYFHCLHHRKKKKLFSFFWIMTKIHANHFPFYSAISKKFSASEIRTLVSVIALCIEICTSTKGTDVKRFSSCISYSESRKEGLTLSTMKSLCILSASSNKSLQTTE